MRNFLMLLGALFVLTACSTTKFDYNTAYKFSQYNYQQKKTPPAVNPVASLKPVSSTPKSLPSDKSLTGLTSTSKTTAEVIKDYKNATKAEKKVIRKQVKEEYKKLRTEVKKAKKEAAAQDIDFNKKMFIGTVILGAGILIAILASGAVGAVAIIVGIGLIAWGIIEQG